MALCCSGAEFSLHAGQQRRECVLLSPPLGTTYWLLRPCSDITDRAGCTWTGFVGNHVSSENDLRLCRGSAWGCSVKPSASKHLVCNTRAGHLRGERLVTLSGHSCNSKWGPQPQLKHACLGKPAHHPLCSWKSSISSDQSSTSPDFLRDHKTTSIFAFKCEHVLLHPDCWFELMIISNLKEIPFKLIFSFLLSHPCLGKILNASPSLFPAIKGGNVHQQSPQTGFKVTGCTVHFVLVSVLLPNSEEVVKGNLPFFPFLKAAAGWGKKNAYRSWEHCQVQRVGVPLHLERQLYSVCLGRPSALLRYLTKLFLLCLHVRTLMDTSLS